RPRIDKELLAAHADGIICLSGCLSSEFSGFLIKDEFEQAEALAAWFAQRFGDRFYVEIQNNGLPLQTQVSEKATDLARKLGLPTVATCDAHYLCQADAEAHDVLLCINTGKLRSDGNRMRYGSNQFYVRPPAEMYELFPGQDEAVRRSQEIADRCNLELDFKVRHFPAFQPPKGKKSETYLRELCETGLKERYGTKPPANAKERLELELGIINRLGFASYFLIVHDFVRFARERGIPAGARGSACGSLVSYVLHLSHVCPLEYDLLFERFLDPQRAEAPDIDIDFCQARREEVIQYVKEKYGEGSVAQIATFGTLGAKAAIRDVGRVLGIDLARVNQLAKLIPAAPPGITLDDALKMVPDLRQQYERDPQVQELIDIARKLEGNNRNVGTHAAGVVIADGPITDYVPVQKVISKGDRGENGESKGEAQITTQWTMEDLEKVGLLKMDFLGLRNLTLLSHAVRLIKETQGVEVDLQKLPLDDRKTYELFQAGQTQGVFQFESEGIRNLLRSLKPDNIRDIIASNALYRPGPLQGGMVDAYINRKHGREEPTYAHAVMAEVLAETYGVMVYQEQIMRLLNRLGGIELSSAYACIKAISKKKTEIIDARRADFVKGSVERGVSAEVAREIFEQIVVFGGYGFNKSHSTAYAHIAYFTAYLKAHYPAEFMAALLTSEAGNTDKLAEHVRDAKELGLTVLPPDVNSSAPEFSVPAPAQVRYGLAAIRGCGAKAAEAIVRERRKNGRFVDLYEFCERIDHRLVPRTALEALAKAGAFDDLTSGQRAAVLAALPAALQAGSQIQDDRRHGQRHIFELFGEDEPAAATGPRQLPVVADWTDLDRLNHEKEAIGFFLSSHPLAEHEAALSGFSSCQLSQIASLAPNQEVQVGGMIVGLRLTTAKRPSRSGETRMARFKLEDLSGTVECVMFPDDFARNKDLLKDDLICFVKATIDRSREDPGLIVVRLLNFQQAQAEQTRGVLVRLSATRHDAQLVQRLGEVLQRTQGRSPVYLDVSDAAGRHARLRLSDRYFVDTQRLALDDLRMLLGPENVILMGPGGQSGNGNGGHGGPANHASPAGRRHSA
ncbi:MAG TPA: DNA polymerase III subunit alpha, partial [Gemmatales bacterium]|nr:DNA polymerase III subunit alpha [Gemmatales bacterium]